MVKIVALLALLAVSASTIDATAVPTTAKPLLKFDKAALNIQGNVVGETISVSLTEKPSDDVVVYIEAPSTRFNKCSLSFSPANFDQPQELQVVSLPFADAAPGARAIPIKFTAFTEDCDTKHHNTSITLPTTRTKEGSGQCQVTGDPHYKQFDAAALYHYQGVGDYYLVKSESLVVQARQGKCFGKASCVHALAVRYGDASFIVDGNDANPDTCVKQVSPNLDGIVISRTRSGVVTTVNVAFNAGSSMKIDIYGSGDNRYMNVFVDVANHMKGKVNGLCGRFDGNAANDFSSPDGQTTYAANEIFAQAADMFNQAPTFSKSPLYFYGESWRVPENENLFVCRDNCPGLNGMKPALPAPVAECKIPTVVPKCEKPEPQPEDPIQQKPIQTTSSAVTSSSVLSKSTTAAASSTSSVAASTTSAATTTSTAAQVTSTSTSTSAQTQGQSTTSSTAATTTTTTKPVDQQTTSSKSSTAASASTTAPTSSSTTKTQPQPTQGQPDQQQPQPQPQPQPEPQPGKPKKPIHVKPRKPICPRPIIVIPIPPGYRRQVQLPRYRQQPLPPVYRSLPQPPKKAIDDAKRGCARKIVRIDQCTVDVSRFIQACEADVEAQVNPEIGYAMHNDAYTDLCAKQIIDKVREPFPDVAQRARQALKKHCFGNAPCDTQCLQCSARGCLECKDRNRFEVQGGRCVPKREQVQYEQQYFSQRPKYRALADNEISNAAVDGAADVDPTFNPEALIETTSVSVAISEDPVKAQAAEDKAKEESKTAVPAEGAQGDKSGASRLALSSAAAGTIALLVSLLL